MLSTATTKNRSWMPKMSSTHWSRMQCAIRLWSPLPTHPRQLARQRNWLVRMAQAVTVLSPEGKASLQRLVLDLIKLTWAAAAVVAMVRWSVSGASLHRRNDVSIARIAGSLRRRCGGSRGFWRFGCGAAVRVCETLSGPSWSFRWLLVCMSQALSSRKGDHKGGERNRFCS